MSVTDPAGGFSLSVARFLVRTWFLRPLRDIGVLQQRLDAVEFLASTGHVDVTQSLIDCLRHVKNVPVRRLLYMQYMYSFSVKLAPKFMLSLRFPAHSVTDGFRPCISWGLAIFVQGDWILQLSGCEGKLNTHPLVFSNRPHAMQFISEMQPVLYPRKLIYSARYRTVFCSNLSISPITWTIRDIST